MKYTYNRMNVLSFCTKYKLLFCRIDIIVKHWVYLHFYTPSITVVLKTATKHLQPRKWQTVPNYEILQIFIHISYVCMLLELA